MKNVTTCLIMCLVLGCGDESSPVKAQSPQAREQAFADVDNDGIFNPDKGDYLVPLTVTGATSKHSLVLPADALEDAKFSTTVQFDVQGDLTILGSLTCGDVATSNCDALSLDVRGKLTMAPESQIVFARRDAGTVNADMVIDQTVIASEATFVSEGKVDEVLFTMESRCHITLSDSEFRLHSADAATPKATVAIRGYRHLDLAGTTADTSNLWVYAGMGTLTSMPSAQHDASEAIETFKPALGKKHELVKLVESKQFNNAKKRRAEDGVSWGLIRWGKPVMAHPQLVLPRPWTDRDQRPGWRFGEESCGPQPKSSGYSSLFESWKAKLSER